MTDERTPPGALTTIATIARLTWRRLVRGRAVVVGLLIAALPIAYAFAMAQVGSRFAAQELFAFMVLVLAVLAPMFVGASIGEEIEERTTTYLWSRPVPRWTVLAGKLVALAPIVAVLVVGSWVVATVVGDGRAPPLGTAGALALGALTFSLIAAGIATLAPRHGMALTISYLLFIDLPLGVLPATLQQLSASYQLRAVARFPGAWWGTAGAPSEAGGLLGLALIGGVWAAIAALRIRRLEA